MKVHHPESYSLSFYSPSRKYSNLSIQPLSGQNYQDSEKLTKHRIYENNTEEYALYRPDFNILLAFCSAD